MRHYTYPIALIIAYWATGALFALTPTGFSTMSALFAAVLLALRLGVIFGVPMFLVHRILGRTRTEQTR